MSTVFKVFPTQERIPTFEELLALSSDHLNAYLGSCGIAARLRLTVGMRSDDEHHTVLPIDVAGQCWWPRNQYAWFSVGELAGGTDAYADTLDAVDGLGRSILTEEMGEKASEFAELVQRALRVGRYWSFRRSAGQPAIINIAYGLIAASLAELTDGIIHSIDSAWDYERLPARPADFIGFYFRPWGTTDPGRREWVERCIGYLNEELREV